MFTAIVLDSDSQNACIAQALALGILPAGHPAKCHHVTLAMGDASARFSIGETRQLMATHYGVTKGRVAAFKVAGAEDSKNKVPHVTIAVFNGAKPKESNEIALWVPLVNPFPLKGKIEICE